MSRSVSWSRRRVAAVLLLVLALSSTGIATGPARAGAGLRGQMLRLTNDDREDHDRKALELNVDLARYAKRHSQDMADAGEIFHTANLAAKLKGKDWSAAGENVGVASSLAKMEATFMHSKPHRRNILNRDYDHVAIGVVESHGSYWVTVIFYG